MSLAAVAIIALAVLVLIAVGAVMGWVIGTNDEYIEVLAKRLAAAQRIEQATRATLHAMRQAVRDRSA